MVKNNSMNPFYSGFFLDRVEIAIVMARNEIFISKDTTLITLGIL